jgi:hypothetical protein
MSNRHIFLAIAVAVTFPITAHAYECSSSLTRTQVHAELTQLENADYRSGHYPADIQAAEAKEILESGTGSNVARSVGGVSDGSSASGICVLAKALSSSFYSHH